MKNSLFFLLLILFSSCQKQEEVLKIFIAQELKDSAAYALGKFEKALQAEAVELIYTDDLDEAQLVVGLSASRDESDDGFTTNRINGAIQLKSSHPRGLLYGILDLTEQTEKGLGWEQIKMKSVRAHYPFRAIKFNLPWFSYRSGENLSLHYETCRDLKFWESFLDQMVENKFNTLSLWNLHPFMFMVQSEEFPKSSPFTKAEMAEWQSFWKELFAMARSRGIEPFIFNWNIFVSEEFSKEYNIAEYSKDSGFWGEGETNELIEQYTREMVMKTINEYDDLAGIGITLGERMGGMTSEERRDWIDRTIIKAIKDADRKVKLFYRAPLSAGLSSEGTTSKSTEILTREAIETIGLDDDILLGFKFNWSHAHSSPKVSIVHGGILTDTYWQPKPTNYKGVWTMRNEDFFALRWAQPDFIREFMKYNSQDYIGGVIVGSETYIPAKDYITKEEFRSWNYAFERQWQFYKVWGNLLYNDQTSDAYFSEALEDKFDIDDATELQKAWKLASQNANRFASFYRGEWDATLYTEGMTSVGGKFIQVDEMIDHPVLDSSYVNIKDFVAGRFEKDQITPEVLATKMEVDSRKAQAIAERYRSQFPDKQHLLIELNDIDAWGYFGMYVAEKIRGGIALQKYRKGNDTGDQEEAVEHLEKALAYWESYTSSMETYNVTEMPYQFDQQFSWRKHIEDAKNDIRIAKE